MNEAQWNRVLVLAPLVRVVHVQRPKPLNFNIPGELRNPVDHSFACTPIETVLPMFEEPFDMRQGNAIWPACVVEFSR